MKPIENYENYFVTKDGNIWSPPKGTSNPKGRYLKLSFDHNGYYKVGLVKNNFSVHRLVAKAFIKAKKGKDQVNHKNGIKTDNNVENLEWVTPSENSLHAFKTGLVKNHGRGESSCRSKLKNNCVVKIREMYSVGMYSYNDLGKIFGVTGSAIGFIVRRINWAHV